MEYTRKCPECKKKLTYSTKGNLTVANKKNTNCLKCKQQGNRNSFFGKTHTTM